MAHPQGQDHLKPLRPPTGKRQRWPGNYLHCSFGWYHELFAVPLPWPLLFSGCWTCFNLDYYLYLVSQYHPVKVPVLSSTPHVYGDKSQDAHWQMLVAQAGKWCLRSYTVFWLWLFIKSQFKTIFLPVTKHSWTTRGTRAYLGCIYCQVYHYSSCFSKFSDLVHFLWLRSTPTSFSVLKEMLRGNGSSSML